MLFPVLLATAVALAGEPAPAHHHHKGAGDLDKDRPAALSGESIYQLDSKWTDQAGKTLRLSELEGKPLVLAMVYTSCPGACPLITADLKKIESRLPEGQRSRVRLALFSLDPERDTPARLKEFAATHALDSNRWVLLTSDAKAVRKLAAVLGVRYKKEASGEFSHSNVITVLDGGGVIRFQQTGVKQDPAGAVEALGRCLK